LTNERDVIQLVKHLRKIYSKFTTNEAIKDEPIVTPRTWITWLKFANKLN